MAFDIERNTTNVDNTHTAVVASTSSATDTPQITVPHVGDGPLGSQLMRRLADARQRTSDNAHQLVSEASRYLSSSSQRRLTQESGRDRVTAIELEEVSNENGTRPPLTVLRQGPTVQHHEPTEDHLALSIRTSSSGVEAPTGRAYVDALKPSATDVLRGLASEAAAEFIASLINFGAVKSYSEPWIGTALARQFPDMDPYQRGALQAALAGPFLATSLFVGIFVVNPAVKSLLGASVKAFDPQRVYPEPETPGNDALVEAAHDRALLTGTQAAGRIGNLVGDVIAYSSFGMAYGLRSLMGGRVATPLGSTVTSGLAGMAMATAHSAVALASRTHDGLPTHYVSKPADLGTVVAGSLDSIMVATTAEGARTESAAWKARNLAQEVLGVELLASVFGMACANTYVTWLGQKEPASSDFESFARTFGAVFATVGTFFFATLSLSQRRAHTDDKIFSGTRGALGNLSPDKHPGSLDKLFRLKEGSFASSVAGVVEGGFHTYRTVMSLPANAVLDMANLLATPFHPELPQPAFDDDEAATPPPAKIDGDPVVDGNVDDIVVTDGNH